MGEMLECAIDEDGKYVDIMIKHLKQCGEELCKNRKQCGEELCRKERIRQHHHSRREAKKINKQYWDNHCDREHTRMDTCDQEEYDTLNEKRLKKILAFDQLVEDDEAFEKK